MNKRRDALETLIATGSALAVAEFLRDALGVDSVLVVAVAAYAAFIGTFVVIAAWKRSAGVAQPERRPPVAPVHRPEATYAPVHAGTTTATLDRPREPHDPLAARWLDEPDWPAAEDRPRVRSRLTSAMLTDAGLAAAAAIAMVLVLRTLLGWNGIMGTTVWAYLSFIVGFFLVTRDRSSGEVATDRVVTLLVWSVAAAVVMALGWMLVFLFTKGLPALRPGFFNEDMSKVGPLTPGGGAFHAIVGTIEQVGMATILVVPVAVLTAVYLHEIKGRLAKPVRFIVDAMSGLPSIVAGLLVFTVWVNGRGFSGASGAAALVVLMLPTVTRTSEEILRTIPDPLREASLALGAPQWRVVLRVVLPTARSGLVTATILGIARAVGETAPMLLTSFGSDSTNWNPFKGPQSDLPLFVWKLIRLPNEVQNQRGFTGALVLVLLVLFLFTTARMVSNRGQRKLGRSR